MTDYDNDIISHCIIGACKERHSMSIYTNYFLKKTHILPKFHI